MGGETFRELMRSSLLTQCRQVELFSTQNGMFVNVHLLTALHKLLYLNL